MRSKHLKGMGMPTRSGRRGRQAASVAWLTAMACAGTVHAAGYTLLAGDGPASVAGLALDLDCGDLIVNDQLDATGTTFTRVGNVAIGASGALNATNASIEVTANWQNSGGFTGAGSTVTVSNQCGSAASTFSGNTTFVNLSATGPHTLSFAAGSEQTVSGALTLNNVTLLGQGGTAYLTLAQGGSQSIAGVSVDKVDASHGQRLAPTLTNQITGSASNWFRSGASSPVNVRPTPVPVNGPGGLALMGLLLAAVPFARRYLAKRA